MKTRPISVTIIGWYLLVTGTLGLCGLAVDAVLLLVRDSAKLDAMQKVAGPVPLRYAVSIAAPLATWVSGYFILRGRNWARSAQ
jgi:hypothetical protein